MANELYDLFEALNNNKTKRALSIIEQNPGILGRRDADKWFPIHMAATCNEIEIVDMCIKSSPETINEKDNKGWTPLKMACMSGHLEVVKLLLKNGALPNISSSNDSTPLHEAALNGDLEIVKVLIENGADPSIRANGMTPSDSARQVINNSPHHNLSKGNDKRRKKRMGKQDEVIKFLDTIK